MIRSTRVMLNAAAALRWRPGVTSCRLLTAPGEGFEERLPMARMAGALAILLAGGVLAGFTLIGLDGTRFAPAMMVAVTTIALVSLALWIARAQSQAEAESRRIAAERHASEEERNHLLRELQMLTHELELRVEARTRDLARSLHEKDVLLKEIHHRVKNNLAIISSLFFLESTYEKNRHASHVFEESQRRVRSMALVHETLYGSSDLGEIDFAQYARVLARELAIANGRPEHPVRVVTDVDAIKMGIDTAVPCGLILNELMSNAFKHAFPDGRTGAITVTIRPSGGRCLLQIADDGVGLPPDTDGNRSFGLRLIHLLAGQLQGSFEFMPALVGTSGRLEFPL